MNESKEKRVVYYAGCSANYWEPDVGMATIRVLERNGYKVVVPKQHCCGVARIGYGDLKGARREAAQLVDVLLAAAGQDGDIVTACPSCAMVIKSEYPLLLDGEKARRVAGQIRFLSDHLNRLHERGELDTGFNRLSLTVAYHVPCHLKAHRLGGESVRLMGLIPGLQVGDLNRGCCGMSGTRGFKKQNYEHTMRIGAALFQRVKEVSADLVVTDCTGCKLQIEQATNTEVTHPVLILDRAYRGCLETGQ